MSDGNPYRTQWQREHEKTIELQREVDLLRSRLAASETARRAAELSLFQHFARKTGEGEGPESGSPGRKTAGWLAVKKTGNPGD
jgi:hypothetical protein